MISAPDPILTAVEVAQDLRCSKAHVYKLAKGMVAGAPRLPSMPLGRRIVFRRSSLERWKLQIESFRADATLDPSLNVDAVGASRSNR